MPPTRQILHLVVRIHKPTHDQNDNAEAYASSSSQSSHTVTYIEKDDILEVYVGFQRSCSDDDLILVDAALIEAIHGLFS